MPGRDRRRLDEPSGVRPRARGFLSTSQRQPARGRLDDGARVYSATAIYFGSAPIRTRPPCAPRWPTATRSPGMITSSSSSIRQRPPAGAGIRRQSPRHPGGRYPRRRSAAGATTRIAASTGAYTLDLTPDYVYESRGTSRPGAMKWSADSVQDPALPGADPQDWGMNVMRVVQATGIPHLDAVLLTQASSWDSPARSRV